MAHTQDSTLACPHCRRTRADETDRERVRLRHIVDALCSCGGKGSDHPDVCSVCLVWHSMSVLWQRDDREASA